MNRLNDFYGRPLAGLVASPDYSRGWGEPHPLALTGKDLEHLGLNAESVELFPTIDRVLAAGAFLLDPTPANNPDRLHGSIQCYKPAGHHNHKCQHVRASRL